MGKLETFCINRLDRPDRWLFVKKILKHEGWIVKKFNAIIDNKRPFLGCTLSHRKIIEIASRKKIDYICVLEDDIVFNTNDVFKKVDLFLKKVPNDWHIIYLGGTLSRESTLKKIQHGCYRVEGLGDTHALIYNHRSYRNLLEYLPKNGIGSDIMGYKFLDHFLGFFYQKKFPCYIGEVLVDQRTDYSDIQKKIRTRNIMVAKLRFAMYKSIFGRKFLIIIGNMLDYIGISKRKIDEKKGFGLDYINTSNKK